MKAPQIIMVVLIAMSLGIHLANHGEPKDGTYNFWLELISEAIMVSLLFWGGFF